MPLRLDYHQSFIRLQIGAGNYIVLTAGAVVIGEVNCYNVMLDSVHFHYQPEVL